MLPAELKCTTLQTAELATITLEDDGMEQDVEFEKEPEDWETLCRALQIDPAMPKDQEVDWSEDADSVMVRT